MECWSKLSLFLFLSTPALAQYTSYLHLVNPGVVTVLYTETFTSNSADSLGNTANKKTLGNVINGCISGVPQPAGFPVGQLYATAALAATFSGVGGCPTAGSVAATISGTGTTAMDNGKNSGGTDSPTTVIATYGGNANDAVCTGDPHNSDPTPYVGLAPASCVANSSAVFSQSTATGHPNSDVLYTGVYASNSTALDAATNVAFSQYFCIDNLANTHDIEFEPNINSSPTAYAANTGAFTGWGFHWNATTQSFYDCPQNCSAWNPVKGVDISGVHGNLTTYVFTQSHCYHTVNYDHRLPGCSFLSATPCAGYDYFTINDVTAGTTPITYAIEDNATGLPITFIPVDNHTFSSGVYDHFQIDMTTANATAQVRVISHTLRLFTTQ